MLFGLDFWGVWGILKLGVFFGGGGGCGVGFLGVCLIFPEYRISESAEIITL